MDWSHLRRCRCFPRERLFLPNGEAAFLFRVPLAKPDGTLDLPFGSFAFRWRSQAERSGCPSGLSRSAGGARRNARFAFRVPPRSKGLARGASPHPWLILPPDPVGGRMAPIPWQGMERFLESHGCPKHFHHAPKRLAFRRVALWHSPRRGSAAPPRRCPCGGSPLSGETSPFPRTPSTGAIFSLFAASEKRRSGADGPSARKPRRPRRRRTGMYVEERAAEG